METSVQQPEAPDRRWLRFSLRTALLVTTAFAVWFGLRASSAGRQRAAVAAIQALGGGVTYDYQAATGLFVPDATPRGSRWLRFMLGRDWFDSVHGVGLYDCNGATDEEIAASLQGVTDTRSLQLDRSNAGQATIVSISGMKSLRNLMLHGTDVDDRGLPFLYKLMRLQNIDLRSTRVSATGIQQLRKALPNCNITSDWP